MSQSSRSFLMCGSRSAGPRPADHTPFGRLKPPSVRGVCLISSSCPGSLTAATGSNLASRRLQECALRTVLSHHAPRGRRWPCGATASILLRAFQIARSGPVGCFFLSTAYRPVLPAPWGGREEARSAGWWGSRLRGGTRPPLRARSAVPQHGATSTFSRRWPARVEPVMVVGDPGQEEESRQTPRPEGVWSAG